MRTHKPKNPAPLGRDEFRSAVFRRDGHCCVFCREAAVDAHHIMERKLWKDGSGGYFLGNGASVCQRHHLDCEMTLLSVEDVRQACGIVRPVLPPGLDAGLSYDKWGNQVFPDGRRRAGPLFDDDGARRILERGDRLCVFADPGDGP